LKDIEGDRIAGIETPGGLRKEDRMGGQNGFQVKCTQMDEENEDTTGGKGD